MSSRVTTSIAYYVSRGCVVTVIVASILSLGIRFVCAELEGESETLLGIAVWLNAVAIAILDGLRTARKC